MTTKELEEIERQLSNPSGENGVKIAENMNETNISMTLSSISSLDLAKGNDLLEIGHGNCGHLDKILNKAKGISYFGLEISETMKLEAERINQEFMLKNEVSFQTYNGNKIPFTNDSFDKIFTVNTLYFWEKPMEFINEIYRVLRPKGIFVLTFAQKDFMKSLPFVNGKFNLYDNKKIKQLIEKTDLKLIDIADKSESVKSKIGDFVERKYTVITLKKN